MEYAIYILATKSSTCLSKLIHAATAAPYTHVSIGLDGLDGNFYSFGRKYTRLLLPAGLIKEGVSPPGRVEIQYQLYRLQVSPDAYRLIRKRLKEMYVRRRMYRFNILGLLAAFFHYPLKRCGCYFCSQFVAETLQNSGALQFEKDLALVRPVDFCSIAGLQLVSEGVMGELGSGRAFPAPSEVVSVLPFSQYIVQAYRFCAHWIG